jgi:DNA-binding FrmR family transcriptional regulator
MAVVVGVMLGRVRIDRHAAHRIDHAALDRRVMMMIVSRSVVMLVPPMPVVTVFGSGTHRKSSLHLASYTLGGYIEHMRKDSKASTLKRLSRIEGQVRGLARMVEDDRYCIDTVTQIGAVQAALRRVEEEILRDHVAHCVEHAIASGDMADQRKKIAELMDVMSRATR